jgi:hypothetical protein
VTDDQLARRAVACRAWRWMPGMRCTHRWTGGIRVLVDEHGEQSESYVVLPDEDGNAVMTIDECGIMGGFPDAGSAYPFLPDLSDPATLGCVLYLVREAWGDGGITTQDLDGYDAYAWVCVVDTARLSPGKEYPHTEHGVTWFDGSTEAEALVAALESAP